MSSIEKKYDEDTDLTSFTVSGTVAVEEILGAIQTFAHEPSRLVMWDFLAADLSALFTRQVQGVAMEAGSQPVERSSGKTALVASSDLTYGLARMYESLSSDRPSAAEHRVFRTRDEALKWLLESKPG